MSDYVHVPGADDLASGSMIEREVNGKTILIARVGDRYLATQGRCPHMGGHLAKGVLAGTMVTCPLHGSQFDLSDGRVIRWTKFTGVALSTAKALRHPRPLVRYDVRVEEGRVLVGPEKPGS